MAAAAGEHARASGQRVGDVGLDLGQRLRVDERALHHAGLGAGADRHGLHLFRQPRGEGLVDAVLHQQAVGADAGLAGVAVLRGERTLHRGVEVGVVEDNEGRVAAELEGDLLEGRRALRHEQPADLGRTGEGEFAHGRVAGQLGADFRRGGGAAGDDVDDAGREAGAVGQFGQRQRGERRLLGRLHHHRAAGGQRRRDLARDHRRREIPRRDGGADADGLLDDDEALVGLGRGEGVAADALGLLGEPLEEARRVGHLAARLGERLALLGGHQQGEVLGVRQHQLVPLAQDGGALLAGEGAPGRPGRVGGGDGAARLGGAHVGHAGEMRAAGGVVDVEGGAAVGAAPGAADQRLGAEKGKLVEFHGCALRNTCQRQGLSTACRVL